MCHSQNLVDGVPGHSSPNKFQLESVNGLMIIPQYPIGSMYGIYANIWDILMVNVTIYSIHGSYGYGYTNQLLTPSMWVCRPHSLLTPGTGGGNEKRMNKTQLIETQPNSSTPWTNFWLLHLWQSIHLSKLDQSWPCLYTANLKPFK